VKSKERSLSQDTEVKEGEEEALAAATGGARSRVASTPKVDTDVTTSGPVRSKMIAPIVIN
jgi:hypothetical protein